MKAVILAGGAGTRLRPLTDDTPKPLVPFLGEPLVFRLIEQLRDAGFREVLLTLGHRAEQIRQAVQRRDFGAVSVRFVEENVPLGTAGSVRQCARELDGETLILGGDCVTNLNFQQFLEDFRASGAPASLAAVSVSDPQEYGTVLTDGAGYVSAFLEKPAWEQVKTDLVSTGMYWITPAVLELLESLKKPAPDFAKDVFPAMLQKNMRIRVYETDAYWCDIGTPQTYLEAHRAASTKAGLPGYACGENCTIAPDAVVEDSVLWDRVCVEAGAVVRGSILCSGVRVGAHAAVQHSVLGTECTAEQNAGIVHAVLDPRITVAAGTAVTGILHRSRAEENDLHFADGDIELVGSFSHAFLSRLCGAVAAFFEDSASVAVISDGSGISEAVACAVKAGLLACGRAVREGRRIASGVSRWMLRNGICDGGVFVTGSCLRLLNGHGNDLTRSERRRFHALFQNASGSDAVQCLYTPELLQDPEEYYISELLNRFRCPHRSLQYFGSSFPPEERGAVIARTMLACFPDAPIFVPLRNGLYTEKIARDAGRYTVLCGEKPGDMMEEMEALMHIAGVYEQYLMRFDDLAFDLGLGMLLSTGADITPLLRGSRSGVFTGECAIRCTAQNRAALLRKISEEARSGSDGADPARASAALDGVVMRDGSAKVRVRADSRPDTVRLFVESFNEEYGADLMERLREEIQKNGTEN